MTSPLKASARDHRIPEDVPPVPLREALPGRGGAERVWSAFGNSVSGLVHGARTGAAIKRELALVMVPASFLVAESVWIRVALFASLALMLAVDFLNTAIERLCNHVAPERHEAIRVTKDLSAAVFFSLLLAGIVWLVAILERLDLIG